MDLKNNINGETDKSTTVEDDCDKGEISENEDQASKKEQKKQMQQKEQ